MKLPDHLSPNEQRALEQAVRDVTAHFSTEVRFVALFGSKARGDFGPDSDIDLLVICESLPKERLKRQDIFIKMEIEIDREIKRIYETSGFYPYL